MKEEKLYAVYGDVFHDTFGIDVKLFGVFTNKNAAEHIKDSLIGTNYVHKKRAWVHEVPVDREVELEMGYYVE